MIVIVVIRLPEICQAPRLDLHWGITVIARLKIVMKTLLAGSILCCAFANAALAQSDVYLCVSETGAKEYRNTGPTKGCKRVDSASGLTIPAPASARKPSTQASAAPSAKAASSPAEFPKVDSSQQKARDSDRRQILLDEMRTEEQKLAEQRKEFNNGEPERRGDERNYAKYQDRVAGMKDDLSRTEKNVEALRREIGNLK